MSQGCGMRYTNFVRTVTILLWLRGWLTESSFGFPTPLPSVLIGDTLNAAWGASGPPLRPCPQRYTVLRTGNTLFTATERKIV